MTAANGSPRNAAAWMAGWLTVGGAALILLANLNVRRSAPAPKEPRMATPT